VLDEGAGHGVHDPDPIGTGQREHEVHPPPPTVASLFGCTF
jgi:hypothetical protein